VRIFLGVALIVVFAVVGWYMYKALGASFQGQKAEAERYPRNRRKFYWLAALALPACVVAGCVIGIIVRPTTSVLGSSVQGDVVGAAVGIVVTVGFLLLAGHTDKPDGPWFTESKSDH
jgi:hypothetical protein